MRPTRFTKQQRRTRKNEGGWRIDSYGFTYMHPVTGDSITSWNLRWILRRRREHELERRLKDLARQRINGVTWEP